MTATTLDQALFENTVNSIPSDRLSTLRQSAAKRFAQSGFPTMKDEDWRYTNLTSAIDISNRWLAAGANAARTAASHELPIVNSIDASWISIRNGEYDESRNELPDGVTITRLSSDETSLKLANITLDDPLAQWNAALLTDVLLISIAAGVTVDRPLGFLINDYADDEATASQVRIVVNIAEGASMKLIEAHASSGPADHYANSIVELDLANAAIVDYVRIQERARHHVQTGRLSARIADNAQLRHCAFDLGGSLIRNDLVAKLQGRDSVVTMNGLYLTGDQQHVDNHTRADHCVGPSTSTEEYRGILNRKSRAVFNGKVVVHKGADGTDASQSNHNLLLSNDAEVDTKPELEIYADDVKCSHGATVGQLDETALFYLRSRGLDDNTAKQLLTRAFAADALRSIQIHEAANYLASAVNERLDTLIEESTNE